MKLVFPSAVLDQHVAILGKTGSGKSSVMRYIAETLLAARKRVCIVDPKGDWWGLKVSSDGKGPGFPVVLFGDFKRESAGDVPINDRSGARIAELVCDGNRPCVIGLRGWTQGAMTRFWLDFASTLFSRGPGDLFLFGDEFHNFAPKQWKALEDKDTPASKGLHWANRLLAEGRGLGLVCVIASQRPQKVHNDTLTSCETLMAMRVVHAADRAATKAWIDGNGDPDIGKDVLASLASLERGEAWVWSPEVRFGPQRVKLPLFQTFDSFAPPQSQKRVSDKGWAEVNLEEVKAALADAVREAEANDPKLLRAEIAKLKKELAKRQPAAPESQDAIDAAVGRAVAQAVKERDRHWQGELSKVQGVVKDFAGRLGKIESLAHLNGQAKVEIAAPPEVKAPAMTPRPAAVSRVAAPRPKRESIAVADGTLSKAERTILTAFYWLKDEEATPQKVQFYSGYTIGSSTWNTALGRLRHSHVKGWAITEEGIAEVDSWGQVEPKPSGQTLREWLRPKLDKAQNTMLDSLCAAYPNRLTNEALSAACGYTVGTSTWNTAIGKLRTLEAAEGYERDGGVKAADVFFE